MCLRDCSTCEGYGAVPCKPEPGEAYWYETCSDCGGFQKEINIGQDEDSLVVAYLALKFILADVELYSAHKPVADAARALSELMVDNMVRDLEQRMEP